MRFQLAILGGGMVGRIAGAVLGGVIFEEKEGRQSNLDVGALYLHVTYGMSLLLERLGLDASMVPIKSGIVWWKHPVPFSDMSYSDAEAPLDAYCMKTRGVPLFSLPDDEQISIMDYAMLRWVNGKPNKFCISASELWKALVSCTERQMVYGVRVKGIEDGQIVTDEGNFEFHTAINTLPLNIMAGYASGLETHSSSTFRFRAYDILFKDYDFLYLPGSDYIATRVTLPYNLGLSTSKEEVWLETPSKDIEDAKNDMLNLGYIMPLYIGSRVNKMKQLCGDPTPHLQKLESNNVKSLGRYAMWDNSLTLSDVAWEVISLAGYDPNVHKTDSE